MRNAITAPKRQILLLAYAAFLSACFAVLIPEVKIAWLLSANLLLLYFWPNWHRLWLAIFKLEIDGWQALLLAYAAFLGACLVVIITGKKLWTLYAGLLIPWSWQHLPELWHVVQTSRLYRLILLYLGYLLASMFWSPQIETQAVLATLACALTLAHLGLLTAGLRARRQGAFDRQLSKLSFLAAFTATLIIAVWYKQHPFPESRMLGFGYLDNPIEGAAVFGVFALIAWHKILHSSSPIEHLGYGLVVLAILAYACLSWTRSVLLALGISLALLTALRFNRQALGALCLLGLAGLVLAILSPELVAKLMRPEPYRPYIWMDAAAKALRYPWFGQGLFADPSGVTRLADGSSYAYAHSHSFFIENLRIGGIVGLGLAIWLLAYGFYQAFRAGNTTGDWLPFALLLYGFLCIAPNGWQLLPEVRIREVWLIFWLPLGLAVSAELLASPATSAQPTLPECRGALGSDPGP